MNGPGRHQRARWWRFLGLPYGRVAGRCQKRSQRDFRRGLNSDFANDVHGLAQLVQTITSIGENLHARYGAVRVEKPHLRDTVGTVEELGLRDTAGAFIDVRNDRIKHGNFSSEKSEFRLAFYRPSADSALESA